MSKNIRKIEPNTCSNKKTASIHEAGHAIIYHIYGYNIDSITISENGSGMVNALSYKPTSNLTNPNMEILSKKLEIYGMICLSGYCAELKFKKIRLNGLMHIIGSNEYNQIGNDIDSFRNEMHKANEILGKVYFDDLFFSLIQTQTRKLIGNKKIWEAILNLSEELINMETNILEGKKVHEILSKYLKHGIRKNGYCNVVG